jgi:hypothetical protein
MAVRYSIDEEARLVTIEVTGRDHRDSANRSVAALFGDPRLTRGFGILIDVDPAARPPSGDEIAYIAKALTTLRDRFTGRIAIVAPAVAHTAAAHLIALLGSAPNLGLSERVEDFADEVTARVWLSEAGARGSAAGPPIG